MTLLCLFLVSLAVGGAHAFTLCGWARSWTLAVRRRQFPQQREADDHPESDWAIVIPARNEANHLTNLLDDLNATLQDHDVNIWVVDDQSEDDTVQVAQQHRLARTGRLRVVGNRGVGKKSAIVTGMEHAKRTWVVTLDADVRLTPAWASTWAHALSQTSSKVAAIAGPVVLSTRRHDPGLWEGVQALDYAAQMGWSAGCLATQKPGSASGANLALRCDVYPDTRHLGPSGDDTLVVQTLHGRGWRVLWLADVGAMVATQGASSLSEWIAQRLRWAGKTKHYPWRTQRTAWWMAWMAFMQLGLVAAAILEPSNRVWQLALGWWLSVTALNVWFVAPVALWFGLRVNPSHWLVLGLTQPLQVPLLTIARTGLLKFVGIPSHATWKGRTCDS